jgi:Tfp pilus tip-associated adhesin PilY1
VLQTRSQLLSQTITTDPAAAAFRQITDLPMDWTVYRGWVENLPDSGERLTGTPLVFNNGIIYNTFVPGTLLCGTAAGYGWLMAVDYLNGGNYGAFDKNGDGKVDDTELAAGQKTSTLGGSSIVTGASRTWAIGNPITGQDPQGKEFKCVGAHCPPPGGGGSAVSRLSWREIIKPE